MCLGGILSIFKNIIMEKNLLFSKYLSYITVLLVLPSNYIQNFTSHHLHLAPQMFHAITIFYFGLLHTIGSPDSILLITQPSCPKISSISRQSNLFWLWHTCSTLPNGSPSLFIQSKRLNFNNGLQFPM